MTNDDRLNELIQGMRRSIVGLADGIASGLMPNMQAFGRAARRAYRLTRSYHRIKPPFRPHAVGMATLPMLPWQCGRDAP